MCTENVYISAPGGGAPRRPRAARGRGSSAGSTRTPRRHPNRSYMSHLWVIYVSSMYTHERVHKYVRILRLIYGRREHLGDRALQEDAEALPAARVRLAILHPDFDLIWLFDLIWFRGLQV